MRLILLLSICVVLAASTAFAGLNPGTIETGFGGYFHISPEPWEIGANMHLLYFLSPMIGFGPYWNVQKTGDEEVDYGSVDTWTIKHATHYGIGALGKMYLPMDLMGGRATPFVEAGFGIRTLSKPEEPVVGTLALADFEEEEETETKPEFISRFGFDYWLTESWTIWAAYHGVKTFADEADGYGPEVTDFNSNIRLGIATFLTK
jgi:hypothetical protein